MAITISGNGISSDAIASLAASKLTGQVPDANAPSGSVINFQIFKNQTGYSSSLKNQFVAGPSFTYTPVSSNSLIVCSLSTVIKSDTATNNANDIAYKLTINGTTVIDEAFSTIREAPSSWAMFSFSPSGRFSDVYTNTNTNAKTIQLYYGDWEDNGGSVQVNYGNEYGYGATVLMVFEFAT